MMWDYAFHPQALPMASAYTYPSIAGVKCKAGLIHKDGMTPVSQPPVPVDLSPAPSYLAMPPGQGWTSTWATSTEPGCQQSSPHSPITTSPPKCPHPVDPQHRGRQEAVSAAHPGQYAVLPWCGDSRSATASSLHEKACLSVTLQYSADSTLWHT